MNCHTRLRIVEVLIWTAALALAAALLFTVSCLVGKVL